MRHLLVQILDKESLVSSGMVTKIKQEIRILKNLRHPNVVELKEVLASRQQIFMVMELVPGGELFDKIIAEGPMTVRLLGCQLLATVSSRICMQYMCLLTITADRHCRAFTRLHAGTQESVIIIGEQSQHAYSCAGG